MRAPLGAFGFAKPAQDGVIRPACFHGQQLNYAVDACLYQVGIGWLIMLPVRLIRRHSAKLTRSEKLKPSETNVGLNTIKCKRSDKICGFSKKGFQVKLNTRFVRSGILSSPLISEKMRRVGSNICLQPWSPLTRFPGTRGGPPPLHPRHMAPGPGCTEMPRLNPKSDGFSLGMMYFI